MKENSIGLSFRIIGTFCTCATLATIFYKLGNINDIGKAVIGIFLGCIFCFLMWIGTENDK